MIFFSIFIGITICFQIGIADEDNYNFANYTFVSIYAEYDDQFEALADFYSENIRVIKLSSDYNDNTEMLVPKDEMDVIVKFTKEYDMKYEVHLNFSRRINSIESVLRSQDQYIPFKFNSYRAIRLHLKSLQKKHPKLMRLKYIGKTSMERPLELVIISKDPDEINPKILVDAGIHGNEWISTVMAMYLIDRLLTGAKDPKNKELNGIDWYILPILNPDGYEYSRSSDERRSWRKTRSTYFRSPCHGVDINQNFDFQWNRKVSSKSHCNDTYYVGPRPFSDPETQMLQKIILETYMCLKLYISLHGYGEYILFPFSYVERTLPVSYRKVESLAKLVAYTIEKAGGNRYQVMSGAYYNITRGTSTDYVFTVANVMFTYSMLISNGSDADGDDDFGEEKFSPIFEGIREFGAVVRKRYVQP